MHEGQAGVMVPLKIYNLFLELYSQLLYGSVIGLVNDKYFCVKIVVREGLMRECDV